MPYKRRYRRRFRRRRKAPRLTKAIRPETKYATLSLASTFGSVNTTAESYDITDTTQGTDSNGDRIGNKIFAKNFMIKGIVTMPDSYNVVRISLMHVDFSFNVTSHWGLDASFNPQTQPRIKRVYWDKYILGAENVAGAAVPRLIKKYVKLNKVCRYASSTDTTPVTGRVVLCVVSDSAASPFPTMVNGYWRMNYTDA
jgi:hypothetical protein